MINDEYLNSPEGKALLAQFASAALTGLLAATEADDVHNASDRKIVAEKAFAYADEMVAAMSEICVLGP